MALSYPFLHLKNMHFNVSKIIYIYQFPPEYMIGKGYEIHLKNHVFTFTERNNKEDYDKITEFLSYDICPSEENFHPSSRNWKT